jgi:DNA-binding response OmpR family regulator
MGNGTILIVDDNLSDLELTRRILDRANFRNTIACTTSPEEAWACLVGSGANLPLLILLDLNFPGSMTGIDFLEKLRDSAAFRRIPVIILTGSDDDMPTTYGLGALAYLTKPFHADDLLKKLKRVGLGVDIS